MNDEPLSEEQQVEMMASVMQRITDAVGDYLRLTKEEGDAETFSDAIVLYEARGIDATTSEIYTRTHYFAVSDAPRASTLLGILEIAGDRLRQACL